MKKKKLVKKKKTKIPLEKKGGDEKIETVKLDTLEDADLDLVKGTEKIKTGAALQFPKGSLLTHVNPANYYNAINLEQVPIEKISEGEDIFVVFPAKFMHHIKPESKLFDEYAYVRVLGLGGQEINLKITPYLFLKLAEGNT